jgi:hypothetical protein
VRSFIHIREYRGGGTPTAYLGGGGGRGRGVKHNASLA